MHRQDAIAFTEKVFSHLNQRDYQQAAQYFADDVTLTGAEPAVLAGRDAVIGHLRQSDAALADSALADSALAVADVLAGETKVGLQLVLTGTHTGSFDMGPGRGVVPGHRQARCHPRVLGDDRRERADHQRHPLLGHVLPAGGAGTVSRPRWMSRSRHGRRTRLAAAP